MGRPGLVRADLNDRELGAADRRRNWNRVQSRRLHDRQLNGRHGDDSSGGSADRLCRW
jgi:hypothetical protein